MSGRFAELGHAVAIGTRDVEATLARTDPDAMGNPAFAQWHAGHADIQLLPFAAAGAHGDVIVNATSGNVSLTVLAEAGAENLAGRVLIDLANPLDHSGGFPPILSVANTDSVGEQIQRTFPAARVVKALNTMNALIMVEPSRLPGDHEVFMAGDDDAAKRIVRDLLGEMGWPERCIVDLGGIRAARSVEMYLPLWLSLLQALGSAEFNIKVVRA